MSQEEMSSQREDSEIGRIEDHEYLEVRESLEVRENCGGPARIEEIVNQVEQRLRDQTDSGCSCEEVSDHLFELLDAQMPKEQAARLRKHMETCPHCNKLAEAENHVREILRRSCCESAPSTLRIRITQQIAVFRSTTT